MSVEMVTRSIQLILAPVLLVSASAILVSALLSHYASIGDRLRLLAHERLDILQSSQAPEAIPIRAERIMEIDHQLPDLLYRHQLVRNAALWSYCSILLFVIDMVVIAAAVGFNSNEFAGVALGTFLAGMLALTSGVITLIIEVRLSHQALDYEVNRVLKVENNS